MNAICLKSQSGHLQLQKLCPCSCSRMRLYLVPFKAFDGRCGLRGFGGNSLSGAGGRYPHVQVISGVLGPKVSQRYKVTSINVVVLALSKLIFLHLFMYM